MDTVKRESFKSGLSSSSKVRSDTVQAVGRLPGEQIKRLEGLVKNCEPRHRAYHGVYHEEALVIHPESAVLRKSK